MPQAFSRSTRSSVPGKHGAPSASWPGRARTAAYVAVAVSLLSPALAVAAQAAVPPPLPKMPSMITIFPERDFISMSDFPSGKNMAIEVTRGGVVIGTAAGRTDQTGLLEVNHPGGVCWDNSTPDLLPGDMVSVFEAGKPDTAVGQSAINVTAEQGRATDADLDGVVDDFVVHGTATDALGARLDLANMEQRVVNPDLLPLVHKRDIRAILGGTGPDGDLAWDTAAGPTNWTATYHNLGVAAAAVAEAGQTRALAWHLTNDVGDRLGITIFEAGEVGGPGFGGCPLGAADVPTVTSPRVINRAAVAAGGDLTVSGVSFNSSAVSVSVTDRNGASVAVATATPTPAATVAGATLPGPQTWTTTIPIGTLAGAPDGELRLAMTTTRVTPGVPATEAAIGGASRFLVKDTTAPDPPAVSLPTGTYVGAQMVTVTATADATSVHYGLGGATAPDPTPASPPVTGQIAVTSSQTLKVIGFDAAGNPSAVTAATYTINAFAPAAVPAGPVLPPSVVLPQAVVLPPAVVALPPKAIVVPPAAVVPGVPAAPRLSAPSAPVIRAARSGARGGRLTATASWRAPLTNGGSKVTAYRVLAQKMSAKGKVLKTTTSGPIRPGARSAVLRLAAGTYRFRVVAVNAIAKSAASARSNAVRAR